MGLIIRMGAYWFFAVMAGYGYGSFDDTNGVFSIDVETVAQMGVGIAGFLATFAASRWGKVRGWIT